MWVGLMRIDNCDWTHIECIKSFQIIDSQLSGLQMKLYLYILQSSLSFDTAWGVKSRWSEKDCHFKA